MLICSPHRQNLSLKEHLFILGKKLAERFGMLVLFYDRYINGSYKLHEHSLAFSVNIVRLPFTLNEHKFYRSGSKRTLSMQHLFSRTAKFDFIFKTQQCIVRRMQAVCGDVGEKYTGAI